MSFTEVLKVTEDVTPEERVLGERYFGTYQFFCSVYTSHEVKLEIKEEGSTWQTLRIGGEEVKFTAAGDVMGVPIAREFQYRCTTPTAGARIVMSKHDPLSFPYNP